MVRTKELSWYNFGEEIKIPVKGSILTRDENGILELRPAGDVDIVRTETSKVQTESDGQSPIQITFPKV